jgi:2-keto-4-pentenoate hydratase/2-oxohepta-3-ene-1,7-dioic acid hydratase in catechol pathway
MKPRTTLNSPYRDIICPPFVTRLDYEAEIAAIIGKNARKIPEDRSLDVVFGYMILHDVSARDIQFKDKQFTRARAWLRLHLWSLVTRRTKYKIHRTFQ